MGEMEDDELRYALMLLQDSLTDLTALAVRL